MTVTSLSNQQHYSFKSYLPVIILITLSTLFYLLTIRTGQPWGGDFSQYIAHAKNIITGDAYKSTGYIYNSRNSGIGPQTYPPVFPAMLAPVYKFYGLDLHAMKLVVILSFSTFLFFFYYYCRETLSSVFFQLFAVSAVAFSPWFWDQKDFILADIPFMLFVYISFYLFYSMRHQNNNSKKIMLSVILGLFCYLAYGTRSLGILLVFSFILHDVFNYKIVTRPVILATVVFTLLFLAQNVISSTHTDLSYIENFSSMMSIDNSTRDSSDKSPDNQSSDDTTVSVISSISYVASKLASNFSRHFVDYAVTMRGFWRNGFSRILQGLMGVTALFFVIFGFTTLLRKKFKSGDIYIIELFAIVYMLVLLFVPQYQGKRYILPIIPLYLLYFIYGLEGFLINKSISIKKYATALIVILVSISYLGYLSIYNFTKFENGIDKKESEELFGYIRDQTPCDSVLIFKKPRILALYTDRKSSAYHNFRGNNDDFWRYIKKINATYIVASTSVKNEQPDNKLREVSAPVVYNKLKDTKSLLYFIEENKNNLDIVFENKDFRVYKIRI